MDCISHTGLGRDGRSVAVYTNTRQSVSTTPPFTLEDGRTEASFFFSPLAGSLMSGRARRGALRGKKQTGTRQTSFRRKSVRKGMS